VGVRGEEVILDSPVLPLPARRGTRRTEPSAREEGLRGAAKALLHGVAAGRAP